MKFCYNTKFTLSKQSQRSRSILQDGSRSLGLFWKEKTLSYNRRNTVMCLVAAVIMFHNVSLRYFNWFETFPVLQFAKWRKSNALPEICTHISHAFEVGISCSYISDKSSILIKKKVIVFPNIFAAKMKCLSVLSSNIWLLTNDVMMTSLVNACLCPCQNILLTTTSIMDFPYSTLLE